MPGSRGGGGAAAGGAGAGGERGGGGGGGGRKSASSPKKRAKLMTSGDENERIGGSSASESPPTPTRRSTRSSVEQQRTPQKASPTDAAAAAGTPEMKGSPLKTPQSLHSRGRSPTSGKEYYHSRSQDLLQNKKVYRAPFKVHLMAWNPRMDLLALVSEKGEVCVKRQGWKTTWKLNVNTEERVLHEFPKLEKKKGAPSCLAWSPDGLVLAVGMTSGLYHIIDAEAGLLRFTWTLGASITRLTWNRIESKRSAEAFQLSKRLEEEDGAAMAEVAESTDDKVVADVAQALELERTLLPRSLHGTALVAVLDDMSIAVLLGGVLCISRVNFEEFMLETYGVAVLSIADAFVDMENKRELIVVYAGGAGTVPAARTGTSYGSWQARGGATVLPGDELAPTSLERHNHAVGLELAALRLLSDRLWTLVARFIRMSVTIFELIEMYDCIQKYWEAESTKVVNRFNGCGFAMGEALISQILTGVSSDAMQAWCVERMGAEGTHALRELYDKHLVEVVENLRSSMLSAAAALSNQLARWADEAQLCFEAAADPIDLLLGESASRPDAPGAFKVHPRFFQLMERASTQQLCTVLRQMVNVAELNGYEIAQLTRWLSLLNPILKASKKQISIVRTCRKYYIPELMRYVVSTFVEEEARREFEDLLFTLEETIQREEEEGDAEIENELEVLSLATPPASMDEAAWYELAKEKKPLPYDALMRDRYFYRPAMTAKRQKYRDQQQADLDARCQYIQLGMNCPAARRRELPVREAAPEKPQVAAAAAEAGPAANTRSHTATMNAAVAPPAAPGSGYRRREMPPFASSPETVRNKLRQLAKSYVASKGQLPKAERSDGDEHYEIDKLSHYFRPGVPLPACVQAMFAHSETPLIPLSLADAIAACVKSVAGVHSSLAAAPRTPFRVRWCNELLAAESGVSLEEGRATRLRLAPESSIGWLEGHVRRELGGPKKEALCVLGWNADGLWSRCLLPVSDETPAAVRAKMQWAWKIRNGEGETVISVRPSRGRDDGFSPMSPPRVGAAAAGAAAAAAQTTPRARQDCARVVPWISAAAAAAEAAGGGAAAAAAMQPLTLQVDDDACAAASPPDHGEPVEVRQAFPMRSGTVLAVVVFENEQGKRQRLVRLNPFMDHCVIIHEDVLRSDLYEHWEISRRRGVGAALSEGATRVTVFDVKDKSQFRGAH